MAFYAIALLLTLSIMKKYILIPICLLIAGYFLGPKKSFKPVNGKIQLLDIPLENLDRYIADKEAKVANIRPDNESRIVWADAIEKTPYSVVYLHGFSATWYEGNGIHQPFAKRYGCNLYLPRLAQHGIKDKDSFSTLTPQEYIDSAKEAIAIGHLLGEKVLVMSCSTGGTLGIYLEAENPDLIDAQFLYSPNIDLAFATSELLTLPWGEQIANSMIGEYRDMSFHNSDTYNNYATAHYKTSGVIGLKALIEETMTSATYNKVSKPYFLGYYYKNEEEQDPVVSVPEMLAFDKLSSTPADQKMVIAFPDVKNHVMVNTEKSEDVASVQRETYRFAEEILGMEQVTE